MVIQTNNLLKDESHNPAQLIPQKHMGAAGKGALPGLAKGSGLKTAPPTRQREPPAKLLAPRSLALARAIARGNSLSNSRGTGAGFGTGAGAGAASLDGEKIIITASRTTRIWNLAILRGGRPGGEVLEAAGY